MDFIENGFILYRNLFASAVVVCRLGYTAAGSDIAYCDGSKWDRTIGTCRPINDKNQKYCDFDDVQICEWTNDSTHDFSWKRKNGIATTRILRTGPKHDHTSQKPLEGFYMLAEAFESTNLVEHASARLLSPVYPASFSVDACFQLHYHMYGRSVGRLRVYVKPVSVEMETVLTELR